MNTFQFTGQQLSGAPQRPFLMPRQNMRTPSPAGFVTSHPPAMWSATLNNPATFLQPLPNQLMIPLSFNFSQVPPPPAQVYTPVHTNTNCLPPLMQIKPDPAVAPSVSTSRRCKQQVSKNQDTSLHVAGSQCHCLHCDSASDEVKDVATKLSMGSADTADSEVDKMLNSIDFSPSAGSLVQKNSATVSSAQPVMQNICTVQGTSSSNVQTSSTVATAGRSVPISKPTSSRAPSLNVSSPSFVPKNVFDISKQVVLSTGNWKPCDTAVRETALESVSEVGAGTSDSITLNDSIASSSAGLLTKSAASTYRYLAAPSSSSSSSSSKSLPSSQLSIDGISPPCIGRGRRLQPLLGSSPSVPQGGANAATAAGADIAATLSARLASVSLRLHPPDAVIKHGDAPSTTGVSHCSQETQTEVPVSQPPVTVDIAVQCSPDTADKYTAMMEYKVLTDAYSEYDSLAIMVARFTTVCTDEAMKKRCSSEMSSISTDMKLLSEKMKNLRGCVSLLMDTPWTSEERLSGSYKETGSHHWSGDFSRSTQMSSSIASPTRQARHMSDDPLLHPHQNQDVTDRRSSWPPLIVTTSPVRVNRTDCMDFRMSAAQGDQALTVGSLNLSTQPSGLIPDVGLSENLAQSFATEAVPSSQNNTGSITSHLQEILGHQSNCSFAQAAARTSGPNDVNMNEVYMSDDDEMENSCANATGSLESMFHRKSSAVSVSSASNSVPSLNPVCPPGFLPPVQQPPPAAAMVTSAHVPTELSGMAFSCGMPLPLPDDLAQIESILRENPDLTQQVTSLIVQQYPLYAANPFSLRFAVCNELKLLKKMRDKQRQAAMQPMPSQVTTPPTPSQVITQPTPSQAAMQPMPSRSSNHITTTPLVDPVSYSSATVDCPEISSQVTFSKSSAAMSSFARKNSDNGTKRPAVAASTTAWPSTGCSFSTAVKNNGNPRRVTTQADNSSVRTGRYVTDSLDSFQEVATPQTGAHSAQSRTSAEHDDVEWQQVERKKQRPTSGQTASRQMSSKTLNFRSLGKIRQKKR